MTDLFEDSDIEGAAANREGAGGQEVAASQEIPATQEMAGDITLFNLELSEAEQIAQKNNEGADGQATDQPKTKEGAKEAVQGSAGKGTAAEQIVPKEREGANEAVQGSAGKGTAAEQIVPMNKEGANEAVEGSADKGTAAGQVVPKNKEGADEAVQGTAGKPFQKIKEVAEMVYLNCPPGKLLIKPRLAMMLMKDPELSKNIVHRDVSGVHYELEVRRAQHGGHWITWTNKCFQDYLTDSIGCVWGTSSRIMPSSSSSGAADAEQPPSKKAKSGAADAEQPPSKKARSA